MKKEMREETKRNMTEIVSSAVRYKMAGMKDLEVNVKTERQSSQATSSSDTIAKQSSQAPCSSDQVAKIFVTGGNTSVCLRSTSTECFNWADQTWTLLNSAENDGLSYSSSFLYQGQIVVAGGYVGSNKTNTLKYLTVADPQATWKNFAVDLPVKCSHHKVVNYNDSLIMSGGWMDDDRGRSSRSNIIYKVQLVPPYSSNMLTTRLPQPRSDHGMELFDKKLFILGGYDGKRTTNSVVQYDLTKNKFKPMPPLPYAVENMATVLWQNNVLVLGGEDAGRTILNKVFMYDVITGHSQMLPCMKRTRYGCTAVLVGNVVVVMGGRNEHVEHIKSVECFDLKRRVWQDLPDMLEPRVGATAVVIRANN